jgi:hypothetical protein
MPPLWILELDTYLQHAAWYAVGCCDDAYTGALIASPARGRRASRKRWSKNKRCDEDEEGANASESGHRLLLIEKMVRTSGFHKASLRDGGGAR